MAIKLIDPNFTKRIVAMSDEAIDKEKSDMAEYQSTYDVAHLKFVEGEVPTYFEIGNIGSHELVQIQQDHYITELPKLPPGVKPDPKTFKPKVTPVKTGEMLVKYFKFGVRTMITGKEEIVMDDEIANQVPALVIQEIGAYIMQRSFLNDAKKKS